MLKQTEALLKKLSASMEKSNFVRWEEIIEGSFRARLGDSQISISETSVDEWVDRLNDTISTDAVMVIIKDNKDRTIESVKVASGHALYGIVKNIYDLAKAKAYDSESTLTRMLNLIPA